MGGVRAQFATPINIRMSLYSIPFFSRFDEVMGHPSGYRAAGISFRRHHSARTWTICGRITAIRWMPG